MVIDEAEGELAVNKPAGVERERWDFFISYTAVDQGWAEWIAWKLEAERYRVLVQAWDLVAGMQWTAQLEEGVRNSDRTILVRAGPEWCPLTSAAPTPAPTADPGCSSKHAGVPGT